MKVDERLAAYAHEAWVGWMRYLFYRSQKKDDGSMVIPADLVERWERQMNTAYVDLPEAEKQSDRVEALKIMKIIHGDWDR